MTVKEQVDLLNETVKTKIAPSPIHGVGVFAIMDIARGEKVYCVGRPQVWLNIPYNQFFDIRKEVRDLILQRWPIVKEGAPFLSPNSDAWLLSFMNHSDDPNYDKYNDTALRDIKAGEEVLEDYGDILKV